MATVITPAIVPVEETGGIMDIITQLISEGNIEGMIIGLVVAVVVFGVSKIPTAWRARVTKVIDKVDEKLDTKE